VRCSASVLSNWSLCASSVLSSCLRCSSNASLVSRLVARRPKYCAASVPISVRKLTLERNLLQCRIAPFLDQERRLWRRWPGVRRSALEGPRHTPGRKRRHA
jgi:hypothetical protein